VANKQEALNKRGQEYIASLQAVVRELFIKCCEVDGIPPDSKFVVFSDDNKYLPFYNNAVIQLMEAREQYAAGGYVGLTIPKK